MKYILYNDDLYKANDLKKIDKRTYGGQDNFWKISDRTGRLRTVKCDEESLYKCDIDFIKKDELVPEIVEKPKKPKKPKKEVKIEKSKAEKDDKMFDRESFENDLCKRYSDWLRGYIGEEDNYLCWCREGIICTYEDKEEDEFCDGCNHQDGID